MCTAADWRRRHAQYPNEAATTKKRRPAIAKPMRPAAKAAPMATNANNAMSPRTRFERLVECFNGESGLVMESLGGAV